MSHLHIELDRAIPLAHLTVGFPQGALVDPPEKEGASSILLRLMRRSIKGLSPEQLEDQIETLGGNLGVDISRTSCGLSGSVITRAEEPFLDLALRVLLEPDFSQQEFVRLKQEIHAGWVESLDDDSSLVRRYFSRSVFAGHPFERLVAGTPSSLARIELADLKNLYKELLHGAGMAVSFAGDVDQSRCERLSEVLRAGLPGATKPAPFPADPRGPEGRHLVFVDKPERTQTQIMIGGLGTHPRDEDHTALFVANTIFGGTFTSRLSHEVRGKRGWSYGASSHLPFDRQRHAFWMWTFPATSDAADCVALQLDMLDDLIERGVTAAELRSAKRYLKNSHAFTLDTATKRASKWLDTKIYDLPDDYFSDYPHRVQAVTREDIMRAVQKRLSSKNLAIVVVGTRRELLNQLEQRVCDLASCRVIPHDFPD